MAKTMFIAVFHDGHEAGDPRDTLKGAFDSLVDVAGDMTPDDAKFYEVIPVEVEIQFVKKEVVKKITKAQKRYAYTLELADEK